MSKLIKFPIPNKKPKIIYCNKNGNILYIRFGAEDIRSHLLKHTPKYCRAAGLFCVTCQDAYFIPKQKLLCYSHTKLQLHNIIFLQFVKQESSVSGGFVVFSYLMAHGFL
jgi:hypothetical protein